MILDMFHRLKKLIPEPLLLIYHRALSWLAAAFYRFPSNKMVIIGVTGTNGKTTTSYLIAKVLEASGYPTGCTTTAIFKIGAKEWLNDSKMTMLGRFRLQRLLRKMADEGCRYAVVETSSQGVVQHRHRHINYDIGVFTNLTPEHIEAHGGFENYKQAKIELFRHLARSPRKVFNGAMIPKTAVLNARDPHARDFSVKGLDRIAWYGLEDKASRGEILKAEDIRFEEERTVFRAGNATVSLKLPGLVNVENALAAMATAQALGLDPEAVAEKLANVEGMPGRFEKIREGQDWGVIVDYAPEPASLQRLYETVDKIPHRRLIHVLGSCGGGRDVARRPILGRMAGEKADLVVITNEDPYDDDPVLIMRQVAEGARVAGKKDYETLFLIEDRKEAIFEAMRRAETGDLVLITGKGCEQAMCVAGGKKIPWDDREVAREAIRAVKSVGSRQ